MSHRLLIAHQQGDCNIYTCEFCEAEDALEEARGTVIRSRADLQVDVIYVNPDGSALRSPDGVGCYFYDSEEEAVDDHPEDGPEVVYLDEPFDQNLN